MALKSYKLKVKKRPKKKLKQIPNLITGAITAMVGVALVSETAGALRSL